MRLSKAQAQALGMLDAEGSYGQFRASSPNFYHERHRPGNLIIDARTARVLVKAGFAEVRFGRLLRTEAGRDHHRATRKTRSNA